MEKNPPQIMEIPQMELVGAPSDDIPVIEYDDFSLKENHFYNLQKIIHKKSIHDKKRALKKAQRIRIKKKRMMAQASRQCSVHSQELLVLQCPNCEHTFCRQCLADGIDTLFQRTYIESEYKPIKNIIKKFGELKIEFSKYLDDLHTEIERVRKSQIEQFKREFMDKKEFMMEKGVKKTGFKTFLYAPQNPIEEEKGIPSKGPKPKKKKEEIERYSLIQTITEKKKDYNPEKDVTFLILSAMKNKNKMLKKKVLLPTREIEQYGYKMQNKFIQKEKVSSASINVLKKMNKDIERCKRGKDFIKIFQIKSSYSKIDKNFVKAYILQGLSLKNEIKLKRLQGKLGRKIHPSLYEDRKESAKKSVAPALEDKIVKLIQRAVEIEIRNLRRKNEENENLIKNIQKEISELLNEKNLLSLAKKEISLEGALIFSIPLKKNETILSLDISNNKIGVEGGIAIASALKKNSAIQTLDLSENFIGNDGASALCEALHENLILRSINLSKNLLSDQGAKAIGRMLYQNLTLVTLNLGNNKISDDGIRMIGESLRDNQSLEFLNLSENSFGPEGVKFFMIGFQDNDALSSLILRNNKIGIDGAKWISQALKKNSGLDKLDLGKTMIGVEGAIEIAEGLKENETMSVLDLSNNAIMADGCKAIGNALHVNTGMLKINLSFNKIRVDGIRAISNALFENELLVTLDLRNNELGPDGAKLLADSLKVNCSIEFLNLKYNNIGTDGVIALIGALKENQSINTLDLSYNQIGIEGGKLLGELLKVNHTLHTIDLSYNKLGIEGAKTIAGALKKNNKLQNINLKCTFIGDDGSKEIGTALKDNKALKSLNLSFNAITSDAILPLAKSLKINTSLQSLNLSSNRVGDKGIKVLGDALKKNMYLKSINIRDNGIEDFEYIKTLKEALGKNRDSIF